MIKIQKLTHPNKRSGYRLPPGETTELRGVVVTNKNRFAVFVDKFSKKTPRRKR